MTDKTNPRHDLSDPERIAAYVAGDLPPSEAAEFERRMAADEAQALRDEVQAYRETVAIARDWMEEPPPGVDRAARIEIPLLTDLPRESVDRPVRVRAFPAPSRTALRRVLVAASIFLVGYAVGVLLHSNGKGENETSAPRSADRPVAGVDAPRSLDAMSGLAAGSDADLGIEAGAEKTNEAPVGPGPVQPRRERTKPAVPGTYHATEKDGRVFIETTRASTGARALWVVDGAFQLADASTQR